jgi:hypothetical protein
MDAHRKSVLTGIAKAKVFLPAPEGEKTLEGDALTREIDRLLKDRKPEQLVNDNIVFFFSRESPIGGEAQLSADETRDVLDARARELDRMRTEMVLENVPLVQPIVSEVLVGVIMRQEDRFGINPKEVTVSTLARSLGFTIQDYLNIHDVLAEGGFDLKRKGDREEVIQQLRATLPSSIEQLSSEPDTGKRMRSAVMDSVSRIAQERKTKKA